MKTNLSATFYKEKMFKETPIGKIPKDWKIVRLGEVLDLKNGERPKISDSGKIPIYGANGIMGYTTEFLVHNDFTIIIGRVGASGEVHLGQGKIWVSDNAIYSRSYRKDKVYLLFLYYLLKSKNLSRFATKTTHPIITQTFLNSFSIQFPPLEEQKAIAHILSTVDEAIRKTDEIIAKTRRLKKGLMQKLLTKGIGHKEFKDTEIGRIPKDWKIVKLGEVVGKRDENVLPKGIGEKYVGLEHIESGRIFLRKYGLDKDVKSAKFKFHRGDILYGKLRPYLDKAVLVDFDGICSTDLLVLYPKSNKIISEYLIYVLHSQRFLNYAVATMRGTNHPRTSWESIARFKLALPPLQEQENIAKIFLTVDKKLEVEMKRKEKLERIKKALMDLLLTGKIRVKVVKNE